MEISLLLSGTLQKFLLFCGIFAPLLYLGLDRPAGRLLKGYSFAAQSMSELSAAGAPTRSLVISVLFFVLAMIVGALAFSGWLRILSLVIPASYVLLAILRLLERRTEEHP